MVDYEVKLDLETSNRKEVHVLSEGNYETLKAQNLNLERQVESFKSQITELNIRISHKDS